MSNKCATRYLAVFYIVYRLIQITFTKLKQILNIYSLLLNLRGKINITISPRNILSVF